MQGLVRESFVNEETVLDVPFIAEEIETAIKRLKVGKAGGMMTYSQSILSLEDTN